MSRATRFDLWSRWGYGLVDLYGGRTVTAPATAITHSENLYLRTLADYVGALGGHIEVNAVFDDDIVPLGLVEKDRGSVAA